MIPTIHMGWASADNRQERYQEYGQVINFERVGNAFIGINNGMYGAGQADR
jgi:hypothetical protein